MKQSRNYKRDSQSECKQALEIWPESGGSRVSAYHGAVSLVLAQEVFNKVMMDRHGDLITDGCGSCRAAMANVQGQAAK